MLCAMMSTPSSIAAFASLKAAIDDGVDIIAHSIRDQDVTPELIAEMKQKNVSYIPTLTRDLSVFVYGTTPDVIQDPFFLPGMSLHTDQVAIVTAPEAQAIGDNGRA